VGPVLFVSFVASLFLLREKPGFFKLRMSSLIGGCRWCFSLVGSQSQRRDVLKTKK
jgi:hypothetical protein